MRAPDRAAEVATSGSGGILSGNGANFTTSLGWFKHFARAAGRNIHDVAALLDLDVEAARRLLGWRE